MSWPKLEDLVEDILRQAIDSIIVDKVDYYHINTHTNRHHSSGYINYSKCCSGGAYKSVCRWRTENGSIVLTEVISEKHRTSKGWELGSEVKFRAEDPELTQKIADHIRWIFNQNWLDRSERWPR